MPIVVAQRRPQRIEGADRAAVDRVSAEVASLEVRRTELRDQLKSLTERRIQLSIQLGTTEGTAKGDLETRLKGIDERTARIDDELNAIDDAINAALARQGTSTRSLLDKAMEHSVTTPPPMPVFQFGQRRDDNLLQALLVGQAVSFVLLALILWRGLRRRVASLGKLAPEDANRLEQLQRSVDVMAVEVERISEGQRYVAKVLNDSQSALGAGAADPLHARRREGEP